MIVVVIQVSFRSSHFNRRLDQPQILGGGKRCVKNAPQIFNDSKLVLQCKFLKLLQGEPFN